jgi:hypothetical protein
MFADGVFTTGNSRRYYFIVFHRYDSSMRIVEQLANTSGYTCVQDNVGQSIFVGEYMLPIARPGTPLYFDFRVPVMARVLTFELVGDLSAFSDEGSEQADSESKDTPLANSLSLVNRVRIYRYVPSAELGKWPLLNAV